MNAKRATFGASLLTAGGLLWLAWIQHAGTGPHLAALRTTIAERDGLVREIGRLNRGMAAVDRRSQTSSGSSAKPAVAPLPATSSVSPPSSGPVQPARRLTREIVQQAKRAELELAYGPFAQLRKIDSEKNRRLIEALNQHEDTLRDLVGMRASSRPDRPAIDAFQKKAEESLQASLRALLGDEDYLALREYERMQPIRAWVMDFAGTSALAADALTLQQAEQLTRALADSSAAFREGGVVEPRRLDWDLADAEAARILTPAQFDLYRRGEPVVFTRSISRSNDRLRRMVEDITGIRSNTATPLR